VVLVVSEQSGAISIARAGKLSRPIDDEQRLVRLLLAITRPPRSARRRRNDVISTLRLRMRSARRERESHAVH